MGLSIVHNFVALHGGKIAIDTGAQGTRIDVAIPALAA
jgi:signal transduction histidine kinase